jgi:hypothetical protein
MLDLSAGLRQSCGDVKPRNVRGRCQKTTTFRREGYGKRRQVAGASAEGLSGRCQGVLSPLHPLMNVHPPTKPNQETIVGLVWEATRP